MQGIQNLSIEFVKEYKGSKYDEEHLKEKIQKALEVIIPKIASIITFFLSFVTGSIVNMTPETSDWTIFWTGTAIPTLKWSKFFWTR